MPKCVVQGCSHRSSEKSRAQIILEQTTKITFHKFPEDEKKRELWLTSLKLEDSNVPLRAFVCSVHFASRDVDRSLVSMVRLQPNAIPCIKVEEEDAKELHISHSINETSLLSSTEIQNEDPDNNCDTRPPKKKTKVESSTSNSSTSSTADVGIQVAMPCTCEPKESPHDAWAKAALREHAANMKKKYQYEIKLLKQSNTHAKEQITNLRALVDILKKRICSKESSDPPDFHADRLNT